MVRRRAGRLGALAFVLKIAAFVLARRGERCRASTVGRGRREFKILIFRTNF
ncbi:MAG TPA: hypothetical protein VKH43_03940 [Thermoanaerobaculia bacterium]|nr:hypothetical protein [Thermoanaerobaculia bacterium]